MKPTVTAMAAQIIPLLAARRNRINLINSGGPSRNSLGETNEEVLGGRGGEGVG